MCVSKHAVMLADASLAAVMSDVLLSMGMSTVPHNLMTLRDDACCKVMPDCHILQHVAEGFAPCACWLQGCFEQYSQALPPEP